MSFTLRQLIAGVVFLLICLQIILKAREVHVLRERTANAFHQLQWDFRANEDRLPILEYHFNEIVRKPLSPKEMINAPIRKPSFEPIRLYRINDDGTWTATAGALPIDDAATNRR